MFKRVYFGAVLSGIFVLACPVWAGDPPKTDAAKADLDVAAYIGGKPISLKELDAKVFKTNSKLAQQLYDARRATVDELILETALGPEAKAKGVTTHQYLQEQIKAKAKPITDADIQAYFTANQARMGGRTFEQVSAQINQMLVNQRETEAREAIMSEVKAKSEIKIVLEPPRVEMIVAANDPFKGSKDAKVTIVEYSEFQ